jgi:hypothetical protein
MVDLSSAADVRGVMRKVFGAAAGLDPDRITDAALLRQAPPPADNLNLPPEAMPGLITESARRLLGRKVTALFASDIVLPDALARQKFGPLANLLQSHFNSLALSASFLVVCDGLLRDPRGVTIATPVVHPDQPARLTFLMRVRDSIRVRICDKGGFEFTQTRGTAVMNAKTIESAMDAVIGGLKDALENSPCI